MAGLNPGLRTLLSDGRPFDGDVTFESHEKVVLIFQDGDEIEGKIAPGNRVELREPRSVYTAIVGDVTEEAITLTKIVRVADTGSVEMQVARAADAEFASAEAEIDRTFLRSDIARVDEVRFDYGRAARATTFWTCGAVVLTLLLGERS